MVSKLCYHERTHPKIETSVVAFPNLLMVTFKILKISSKETAPFLHVQDKVFAFPRFYIS